MPFKLLSFVEILPMDARFLPARKLMIEGDAEGLKRLLAAEPELATARSSCSHPTLMQCLVLDGRGKSQLESMIKTLAGHGSPLTDPLIAAASADNPLGIAILLDLGADIDGNGHWSPLEEALYWGHPACVDLLVQRGAAINRLRKAAGLGRRDLIAQCFGDDGQLTPLAGEMAWPFGNNFPDKLRHDRQSIIDNALIYAAAWGHIDALDDLLNHGANLHAIPPGFDFAGTALHYAALQNQREMAHHLLELGADPQALDTKVKTMPENWAQHGGHHDLAQWLRAHREAQAS